MGTIGMTSVRDALAEFFDQRVLPAIGADRSALKWLAAGASTLMLARFDTMSEKFIPTLKTLGLVDETGNLDISAAENFIRAGFDRQEIVQLPIAGIPIDFDRSDGDALIALLKQKGV